MSRAFRAVSALMTAVFLLSVVVQWNDPDPELWIALYGVAASLSLAAAVGHVPWLPNVAALCTYLAFTAAWVPSLVEARPKAFASFEMKQKVDEEPREAGGLLMCTAWSAFLVRVASKQRTSPATY